MGGEEGKFTPGNKRLLVDLDGWKICPLICYDLRFPVWSRNDADYDLLIYVANWPHSRKLVWDTLLRARAIENQSYVCAVNRTGLDGEGIAYSGGSMVIDPKGQIIADLGEEKEIAGTFELSLPLLHKFRESFPVLNDRDSFEIKY
jgi:omega-amidase